MTNLIDQHRDEVAALCRRYGVRKLELFGSATTGAFDPQSSDLDFLVEFDDVPPAAYAKAYFALKEGGWNRCSAGRWTLSPGAAWPTPTSASASWPSARPSMHAELPPVLIAINEALVA